MAVGEAIVIAVIGIIVIEGVWLAALTWLLWRRSRKREAASGESQDTKTA